ncbi:hypothetical protein [Microcystis phage MJing1]|nr:hypothetical protein [Microcystis phage MJing1]
MEEAFLRSAFQNDTFQTGANDAVLAPAAGVVATGSIGVVGVVTGAVVAVRGVSARGSIGLILLWNDEVTQTGLWVDDDVQPVEASFTPTSQPSTNWRH